MAPRNSPYHRESHHLAIVFIVRCFFVFHSGRRYGGFCPNLGGPIFGTQKGRTQAVCFFWLLSLFYDVSLFPTLCVGVARF